MKALPPPCIKCIHCVIHEEPRTSKYSTYIEKTYKCAEFKELSYDIVTGKTYHHLPSCKSTRDGPCGYYGNSFVQAVKKSSS